jgi:hypothetical protein
MSGVIRCQHCGEVIGVYEPMVLELDGRPRRTSRLVEGERPLAVSACFHDACYAEAQHNQVEAAGA